MPEILEVIFIVTLGASFFPKYYWHFRYQKLFDPQLQNVDFMGFLFSFGSHTALKLKFFFPLFFRNRIAETRIPAMKELGSKTFLASIIYSTSFLGMVIITGITQNGNT